MPGGALRPDTIVMAWRGMDIARRAAQAGHHVIATPVMPTYFDYYQADDEREPLAIGGPVTVDDVAAFSPSAAAAAWSEQAARHLVGTQFQLWTEYIRDSRALDYMAFPRACALAEVAWSGGPAARPKSAQASPAQAMATPSQTATATDWHGRLAAHLRRLDAAGVGYRPLKGPHPRQEGGSGLRGHRAGDQMAGIAAHLDKIARQPDVP